MPSWMQNQASPDFVKSNSSALGSAFVSTSAQSERGHLLVQTGSASPCPPASSLAALVVIFGTHHHPLGRQERHRRSPLRYHSAIDIPAGATLLQITSSAWRQLTAAASRHPWLIEQACELVESKASSRASHPRTGTTPRNDHAR